MKIAFCDNSLRELLNFRQPIMESFLNTGLEIVAICPKNHKVPNLGRGFKFVPVKLSRGGMNPIKDLVYFLTLLKIYRNEKVGYVFHYTIKPNIYGTVAARLLGIRSTMMIAGLGYVFTANNIGSYIGRCMYRIAIRFSEHVLVLNQYNYDLLLEKKMVNENKLILLEGGEGLDLRKYDI